MNVTLRQMRAFVAVAQTGGFSAAAVRLHVTQSAASTLVQTLEAELDVVLFERTTRRVVLTDAGRELLPEAERLLGDLKTMLVQTRARSMRARGRLVIAATPTAASLLLPRALERVGIEHPDVLVVVRDEMDPARILGRVLDGDADLGIGPLDHARRDLVDRVALLQDAIVLVAPHRHHLARRRSVSWADLEGEPFVGFGRENPLQILTDEGAASAGIRLHPRFEASSIVTALALVAQGLAVAALPSYATPLGDPARIRVRPLLAPELRRDLYVLKRHGRSLPESAATVLQALTAAARPARRELNPR